MNNSNKKGNREAEGRRKNERKHLRHGERKKDERISYEMFSSENFASVFELEVGGEKGNKNKERKEDRTKVWKKRTRDTWKLNIMKRMKGGE